jgi:teichuronic acid biosynthesis glycosyltransferase TuaG
MCYLKRPNNMNSCPLVSIIMPIYNTEKYVGEAIDSVLNQTYLNWELLLIDDCSTDLSREIAFKKSANDDRIFFFENHVNSGSGYTRNVGIDHSKGDFIAFLDSDDVWCKKKLELQISQMVEKSLDFTYGKYCYLDINGNFSEKFNKVSSSPISYRNLLKNNEIGCLTVVYNSKKIGKCYFSNHRNKQDYGLWLSILKKGFMAHSIDGVLGGYRKRRDSATGNKLKMLQKHLFFLMETQNIGFPKAFYYTVCWLYFATIKRF